MKSKLFIWCISLPGSWEHIVSANNWTSQQTEVVLKMCLSLKRDKDV